MATYYDLISENDDSTVVAQFEKPSFVSDGSYISEKKLEDKFIYQLERQQTEREAARLQKFIDVAKENCECDFNLLPKRLGNKLKKKITFDVDYSSAREKWSVTAYCDLLNPPFSEKKWDKMDSDQQIKYIMKTAAVVLNYEIVEICNLVKG